MDRSSENGGDAVPDGGRGPVSAEGILGGRDTLSRSLERWAAEAAVDEAARGRARARWLRVQSEESATLVGALVELAERGRPVTLEIGGHRVRGALVGIGADFVALRTDRGQQVLVRTSAIDVLRSEPGGEVVRGDRGALLDVDLHAVLGPVAADRPEVLARTSGGDTVRGGLRSVGTDVLQLRVDGDPPTPTWVPLAALVMLVIHP